VAALDRRGPTGPRQDGQRDRPKLKSGEPPEAEQATADERSRGRARDAAPMDCPEDPKEAKPRAAQFSPNRPATNGWHGRVNAQKASSEHILIGRATSRIRERVWFGLAAGAPTKINRGRWCSTPTTRGHPSRRTRTELSGRSKSCEGRNPMSGAGSRATKRCPRCRPGGENPTERDRNARLMQKAPGRMSQMLIGRRFERRWMDSIAW